VTCLGRFAVLYLLKKTLDFTVCIWYNKGVHGIVSIEQ
jgi:hypothetical protein